MRRADRLVGCCGGAGFGAVGAAIGGVTGTLQRDARRVGRGLPPGAARPHTGAMSAILPGATPLTEVYFVVERFDRRPVTGTDLDPDGFSRPSAVDRAVRTANANGEATATELSRWSDEAEARAAALAAMRADVAVLRAERPGQDLTPLRVDEQGMWVEWRVTDDAPARWWSRYVVREVTPVLPPRAD
jgi:hypothetical protein